MERIDLGDIAKDTITGLEGMVVATTDWLHACRRITIQPQNLGKDGQPLSNYTIDEPQAKLVRKKDAPEFPNVPIPEKTGGPSISPIDRGGPL